MVQPGAIKKKKSKNFFTRYKKKKKELSLSIPNVNPIVLILKQSS